MSKKESNKNNFDPYKVDKLARFPMILKVLLLKFWGAGATGYLVFLGLQFRDLLDSIAGYALIFGIILEWVINRIIKMMETPNSPTDKYCLVTGVSFISFILNILYAFAMAALISFVFYGSLYIFDIQLDTNYIVPLVYGVLFVLFDCGALQVKRLVIFIKNKIKNSRKQKEL